MWTVGGHSFRRGAVLAAVAVFCIALNMTSAFAAGKASIRVALVVGNSRYETLAPLSSPSNDAQIIEQTLETMGFDVSLGRDLSIKQFRDTVRRFSEKTEQANTVLFYYAGHGFQYEGENYLAPVDVRLAGRKAIAREAIEINDVIRKFQRPGRTIIVFLDASRENPMSKGNIPGLKKGLARIADTNSVDADLYVAFSTSPGVVTPETKAAYGAFAMALAQQLPVADIDVLEMMTRVRDAVEAATDGAQTPWEQSALSKPFYFHANASSSVAKTAVAAEDVPDFVLGDGHDMQDAEPDDVAKTSQDQRDVSEDQSVVTADGADQEATVDAPELVLDDGAKSIPDTAKVRDLGQIPKDMETSKELSYSEPVEEQNEGDQVVPDDETSKVIEPDTSEEDGQITSLVEVDGEDTKPNADSPMLGDMPDKIARMDATTSASDDGVDEKADLIIDAKVVTTGLQTELLRMGCLQNRVDGKWGRKSDAALARYVAASGRETPRSRDAALLRNLKSDLTTKCN
jgi:uncharacterized caspase-like protein